MSTQHIFKNQPILFSKLLEMKRTSQGSSSRAIATISTPTTSTSSLALAQAIFSKAAEGKRLAEKRKRQQRKESIAANAFRFSALPFDIQEMVLRFLPASEIGMACAVCKSWNHIYQGAVASIFAQVVGVARGRSRLMRRAELQLVHRLRNTHEKDTAIETALWAAFNGYNNYVVRLVTEKRCVIEVNTQGSDEWDLATVLHVACRQGNSKLVRSLLDLGANPACLTKSKQTPLILACEYGYPDIVELLLRKCGRDLNVNNQDSSGRTALFVACDKGHVEIVERLVDWGEMIQQETGEEIPILDLNLGTLERGSPLCTACRTGQSRIVRRLLDAQVNVNSTTEDGRTAFYCAVERGALNTTKLLLEKRPPITNSQMMELLFEARPRDGRDAAAAAAETETEVPNMHPGRAGVLIDFASNTGKTPAFVAAERGNTALLQVLMDGEADTNKPTFLNKTPLYAATENGHTHVVKMLLTACTREQVLHQTNFGTTAPFMAQRNGFMAIKRLLDEFCADQLTTEKARKRKSKKKQKTAMDRLQNRKDKPGPSAQRPANTSSFASSASLKIAEMSETAEGRDRDVTKSKAAIDAIVQGLDNLEIAVDIAFSRQQHGLPREGVQETTYGADQKEKSKDSSSTRDSRTRETHPASIEVEVPESQDEDEEQYEQEKSAIESERSAQCDHRKSAMENIKKRKSYENTDACSPSVTISQNQGEFDSPVGSSTPQRQVPRKEKDLIAARNWSKSNIRSDELDSEDARSGLDCKPMAASSGFKTARSVASTGSNSIKTEFLAPARSLDYVRSSLLAFSSATSSSKMTDEIYAKTFGDSTSTKDIYQIYQSMKASKDFANAWDLFVAMTLLTQTPADEKLDFCFSLFDVKAKGHVELSVARTMLRCCCKSISRLQDADASLQTKEDFQEAASDLAGFDLQGTRFEADSVDRLQFIGWAQRSKQGKQIFADFLK